MKGVVHIITIWSVDGMSSHDANWKLWQTSTWWKPYEYSQKEMRNRSVVKNKLKIGWLEKCNFFLFFYRIEINKSIKKQIKIRRKKVEVFDLARLSVCWQRVSSTSFMWEMIHCRWLRQSIAALRDLTLENYSITVGLLLVSESHLNAWSLSCSCQTERTKTPHEVYHTDSGWCNIPQTTIAAYYIDSGRCIITVLRSVHLVF